MKTEIFAAFLDTRKPIWNLEILEYDWVELSDKIVHFLFKNGVTAKIQWRYRNILSIRSTLRMMKCKRLSIDDLSRYVRIYRNRNFRKMRPQFRKLHFRKLKNATTKI